MPEESKEPAKVDPTPSARLQYDKEWLAILALAEPLQPLEYDAPRFPETLLTSEAIALKMSEME